MKACKPFVIPALVFLLTFFASCATIKNTKFSRLYQSTVTKYNTYFNGHEAYKRGYEAQEKSIKDNYIDMLLLFPISDEKARSTGKEDFDLAIEKAQKCVKLHSISAKPKKKGGSLSENEKRFLDKNEYNPFLWNAWMLMADAQMQKGEFLEAAGTYSYICNLYFDEPEIISEARIKTLLCYSEMGWSYETEELLSRIKADTIPPRLLSEYNSIVASYLFRQERFEEGLPFMEKGMRRPGMSKTGKIREKYLLGQLYKATGQNEKAYSTFQEVIRMNPPYRIEFNARIQQTETMPEANQSKLFKKLNRMGKDPNNKDYLDQIYYAIGNIYLSKKDTVNALINYEIGVEKGTRNGPEKGILLLNMANLYWEKTDYANAGRCYSNAVGLIDQKNELYETVKIRSQVLEDLAIHNDNIILQDSLQKLATLDRQELDTIIGGIIERLIQSEEAAALAEAEKNSDETATSESLSFEGDNSSWYFYNTQLVQNGKNSFVEHWGRRKFEDDWRRINKTTLSLDISSTEKPEMTDSISGLLTDNDSTQVEIVTDKHKKEYYLQQIPFTDEQKNASDKILTDALFNAGIIYKDLLVEYESAERSFNRIIRNYPEADETVDALYNLYLMYSLWEKNDLADSCKSQMSRLYPENEQTLTICDSNYIENAKYGKHREDSLYAETYDAYKSGDTALVIRNCNISAEKYPLGYHRPKFMFLEASCLLQEGNTSDFLDILRLIVEKYPQNEISELAGLIAQGVQDGKILQSNSFSSIWEQRSIAGQIDNIPDSVKPTFSEERYQPYLFILAYPKDSINENRLLFEIAKYNFTNFMVRNFDIGFSEHQGIGMMTISEFMNYDEAYFYQQKLFGDNEMAEKIQGLKSVIITEENLQVLLQFYSFQDYSEFYEKHFLTIPDIDGSTLFEETDDYE